MAKKKTIKTYALCDTTNCRPVTGSYTNDDGEEVVLNAVMVNVPGTSSWRRAFWCAPDNSYAFVETTQENNQE